jgi:hypothetical protein
MTQNSDPAVLYRVSLGLPVITFDAYQTISGETARIIKLNTPVTNANSETGIYKFNQTNNFKDYDIATQCIAYNYQNGEIIKYPVNDNEFIDKNGNPEPSRFALKEGVVLAAWVNATPTIINHIEKDDSNTFKYIKEELQEGANIRGNIEVLDPAILTVSHYRKMPAPVVLWANGINGFVCVGHAGNVNGRDTYLNRHFEYTIKRPNRTASGELERDDNDNLIYSTIYTGTTAFEGEETVENIYKTTISASQKLTGFYLKNDDKLIIKSKAAFYDDSLEIEYNFNSNNITVPEGLEYEVDLTSEDIKNYLSSNGFDVANIETVDLTGLVELWGKHSWDEANQEDEAE